MCHDSGTFGRQPTSSVVTSRNTVPRNSQVPDSMAQNAPRVHSTPKSAATDGGLSSGLPSSSFLRLEVQHTSEKRSLILQCTTTRKLQASRLKCVRLGLTVGILAFIPSFPCPSLHMPCHGTLLPLGSGKTVPSHALMSRMLPSCFFGIGHTLTGCRRAYRLATSWPSQRLQGA